MSSVPITRMIPPKQTRHGLSLGWLGSIPGLSGSKAHDLPPHRVLSYKILLVEGTGRPAPSSSVLWYSDFLGSLAYSWVFCNFQLWSPGQSTVLYSCFLQALLPLTISNAKTWKILSIWWKPGLNVRHFAAFKNRRCLSRKQFFLDDSGLSLCASLMYHIILRLPFQVFIFFPSVSVVTLPAVTEIVTDCLSLPLGCFSPAVNKEIELLGFLFYFFGK